MNNVKNFINYGINRSITVKDLRKMPFGLSIFSLIEIIICLILGGGFLVVGFAVAVITLFVIAFVQNILHCRIILPFLGSYALEQQLISYYLHLFYVAVTTIIYWLHYLLY